MGFGSCCHIVSPTNLKKSVSVAPVRKITKPCFRKWNRWTDKIFSIINEKVLCFDNFSMIYKIVFWTFWTRRFHSRPVCIGWWNYMAIASKAHILFLWRIFLRLGSSSSCCVKRVRTGGEKNFWSRHTGPDWIQIVQKLFIGPNTLQMV